MSLSFVLALLLLCLTISLALKYQTSMKHVSTYEPTSSVAQVWKTLLFFCWLHELFFVPFIAGFMPRVEHPMYTVIELLCDAVLATNTLYMAPRIQKIIEGELVT